MADAGYADGFEVTLDCPNNRYINDEKICLALAAMWAQLKVKVNVNAMPRSTYFPKIDKLDTSLYMLGWGLDHRRETTFTPIYRNRGDKGRRRLQLRQLRRRQADAVAAGSSREADPTSARRRSSRPPAAQRSRAPHSAAPPVHPLGRAQQRAGSAPRRQLASVAVDHGEVTLRGEPRSAPSGTHFRGPVPPALVERRLQERDERRDLGRHELRRREHGNRCAGSAKPAAPVAGLPSATASRATYQGRAARWRARAAASTADRLLLRNGPARRPSGRGRHRFRNRQRSSPRTLP